MVLRVEPGSLRAVAAALRVQSKNLNGMRRELDGLGALGDTAAQEGLNGLVVAFGAVFEVLDEDLRFMSGTTTTAAGAYERVDGPSCRSTSRRSPGGGRSGSPQTSPASRSCTTR